MKVKNQYLKILEYFLRSIKKRICKTEKFKLFKVCSFMHSILGLGSCICGAAVFPTCSQQHVSGCIGSTHKLKGMSYAISRILTYLHC